MQKTVHFQQNYSSLFLGVFRKDFSLLHRVLLLAGFILLLSGFTQSVWATDFYKNFVIVNGQYYNTKTDGTFNSPFLDRYLGSFDRTSGRLVLTGAEANTFTTNNDGVEATRLYYTVYPAGQRPQAPVFTPLNLPFNSAQGNNQKWATTTANINLISLASFVGDYKLEVYFQGDGTYPPNNTFPFYDGRNGDNYTASFSITGTPPLATGTNWRGTINSDWFNAGNWSAGVPSSTIDAIIPVGAPTYPQITNSALVAEVRTLQIEGTSLANRGNLTISDGQIRIYGDFINPANGFIANGGFVILSGTNQNIDAGFFYDLRVDGGGVKKIRTRIDVQHNLDMADGILETEVSSSSGIDLRRDASINGESAQSYVRGIIRIDRALSQNATDGFGNLGVILTPYGAAPGLTFLTRTTSEAFRNIGGKSGIKRSFEFRPENNTNLNASMVFRYQDVDLVGTGVVEANMNLFVNLRNSSLFVDLKRSELNAGVNALSQNGINELRIFTLGDGTEPLPVALTSFTATRQGENAALTWATAQEENNAGFDVQVSTDGQAFRTLTTITPKSPNTTIGYSYKYLDKEAGKTGVRYYRLRQVDLDGKESFYGPQAVAFGDATLAFSAAPNPFTSEVTLTAQTSLAGNATLRLTDINGRTVREQTLALEKGVSTLPVANLDALKGGMYFVQLTLPDGQVQRAKVLKQ